MTLLTLENAALAAQFDRTTGALVALCGKATGWELLRRRELGASFLMELPLPQRHKNYIRGAEQRLARAEVSDDGAQVTFVWEGLRSEHGGAHDITFTATARLGDDGLTFTGTVDNRSDLTVEAVCYPYLGDVTPPAPGSRLERLHMGYCALQRTPLRPQFANNRGYWGFDWAGNNGASSQDSPFALLNADDAQGWYIGCHDAAQTELVQYFAQLKPGHLDTQTGQLPTADTVGDHTVALEFFPVHFPYVRPGASFALAPIVLQPYVGDWHAGADCYTAWRATWFTRPATPAWAQDIHAWQQFQMNGSEDDLRYRYTDLPMIAAECARHGVGAIQLVGWNDGGQDRGNPSHDTDPRLGTWDELRDAIAQAHALGVKMILFSKFTWADRSQPWFREEGYQYATQDPYGDAHVYGGYQYQTFTQCADINTRRFSPLCPLSAAWREVAAAEFTKVVDLGAAGMLYDECQHHGGVSYCFDPSHGHHVPGFVYAGDNPLAARFHRITDARHPDFLFAGEANYDYEYLQYHLSYFRIGAGTGHLQRYLDPFLPMMVAVTGFDDRRQLNKCLQHRYLISYEPFNFHGRLEDFPRTLAYGKQIDALRRRYRAYLWDAEYRDSVGAGVTVDEKPYADVTVFVAPNGKRAAAIANIDQEKTLTATLAFAGGAAGPLTQATPEAPDAVPCDGTVTLPPRSVVVVMEG